MLKMPARVGRLPEVLRGPAAKGGGKARVKAKDFRAADKPKAVRPVVAISILVKDGTKVRDRWPPVAALVPQDREAGAVLISIPARTEDVVRAEWARKIPAG